MRVRPNVTLRKQFEPYVCFVERGQWTTFGGHIQHASGTVEGEHVWDRADVVRLRHRHALQVHDDQPRVAFARDERQPTIGRDLQAVRMIAAWRVESTSDLIRLRIDGYHLVPRLHSGDDLVSGGVKLRVADFPTK